MNQIQKKQIKRLKYFINKSSNLAFLITTTFLLFIIFVITTIFKEDLEFEMNGYYKFENYANGMSVYYLDVGQGDCTFIRFDDGKTMLIDSGTRENSTNTIDFLVNYAFKNKELCIDYVLLTHSDLDHSGGLLDIMHIFQVNYVFRPRIYDNFKNDNTDVDRDEYKKSKFLSIKDEYYHNLIESFYDEPNCEVIFTDLEKCNQFFENTNYSINFYFPTREFYSSTTNDYSPVFSINYNDTSFLFTGDTNESIEEEILNRYELSHVDFLKVAHHGSKTATSNELLRVIEPKNAIISSGTNSYGHPTWQVINRLKNYKANILRTDELGYISVNVLEDNISVKNFKIDKVYINIGYFNIGLLYYFIYVLFTTTKENFVYNNANKH